MLVAVFVLCWQGKNGYAASVRGFMMEMPIERAEFWMATDYLAAAGVLPELAGLPRSAATASDLAETT
jgi:hypothetical protein